MSDLVSNDPVKLSKPNKRQRKFIQLWLNPNSDTFNNAYLSAIEAGFSKATARNITGNARGLQWIQDAKQLYAATMSPEHIYAGIQDIAINTRSDRDKLQAYALLGKYNGLEVSRSINEHTVTFTNSVPRPVIEVVTGNDDAPITD